MIRTANSLLRASRRTAIAALVGVALAAIGGIPAISAAGAGQNTNRDGQKVYRIGFHLWKPGKIYDEAMAGITDGLRLEGIRFETVILESDRNPDKAADNLRQLDQMGLDLIYSLSSAGTKIANKLNLTTPVIATVINHPASLGVNRDTSSNGTQLTGTSYYVDAEKQLKLYLTLFPKLAMVGMIFDTKNPAGYLAEEPFMRDASGKMGLKFMSIGISTKDELAKATQKLVKAGVDLIVVPTNRLVYGNLQTVLAVSNGRQIPVVSMNKQGVENGALAGLFADTYNLGRLSVPMAMRIMRDRADPADIGFAYISQPEIILNMSTANQLSYEFPAAVLGQAAIVME